MTNVTPTFDGLLKQHEAPTTSGRFDVDRIDEFLKEAHKINAHISSLHAQLLSVRQAYLSTAQPRKTPTHLSSTRRQTHPKTLTDREREEIDANAKRLLRDLNAQIRALSETETLRRQLEATLLQKKYAPRFGRALGSWAAGADGGGILSSKSPEQIAAEEGAAQVAAHRESVLWYLRQRLQRCGSVQADMMDVRLTREVERNRSVLAKAGGPGYADFATAAGLEDGMSSSTGSFGKGKKDGQAVGRSRALIEEEEEREKQRRMADEDLTPEELQMFAKGNQAMMEHYETTLDKVKTAEKSLLEISELQTMLINNLTTQSSHIEQLVADSFNTAENVGGGNKQLKKAAQRGSPARLVFFAASGLCAFLILWDLII